MVKINTQPIPPEKTPGKPRILVAPLDWGLGHATRCIPVIYTLMAQNAEVWVAAEGAQEILLKKEFPGLSFLPLSGYRVRYGGSAKSLFWKMLWQTPRILRTIKKEHRWLNDVVIRYGFDAVISDNRYGLYHPSISTIFITHQLAIKTPLGKWAEGLLQRFSYKFINRFGCCWIPDQEEDSLAGELSHPSKMPSVPVKYIGILSRLQKNEPIVKKHRLFISLSGPEPQRTLFENKIVNEISHYKGTATIVRGLPANLSLIPSTNDIKFYNHLTTEEYNREMEEAELVISRSGYSTIMDLARLEKKSILVPTPGQTEQQYLAEYMEQLQMACYSKQDSFSLNKMLETAEGFPYKFPAVVEDSLTEEIMKWVGSLKTPLNLRG
jgi:UDP-N-acetylglucosamine transferase subunit ALG13